MFNVAFGLHTYCVLLGSYIASCLPFEIIYQLRLFEEKRIQPKIKCSHALRWKAFSMVGFNFSWLLVILLCASPVLEKIFHADRTLPSVLVVVFQIMLSFVVDDMSFYSYHRYLHMNKELYILYHKPHHVFKAPFAWTVSAHVRLAVFV
jgi:sterol desaturase/sphingolipid hydroxylase (fatty acid hydroxylase superfamily)